MASQLRERFISMYETNYADLLRYVRRRAHPSIADDVVAETFAIAWRRRHSLPEEPRAWLFRTAANLMKSAARDQAHQSTIAIRSYESPNIGPDVDDALDVIRAWRALARPDQEVLALHVWEDLPDREAAKVLGCTRAAFAMRLSRAKKRLARLISDSPVRDPRPPALVPVEKGAP